MRCPHLNFKPNTKHLYSNAGYALLASIVESVSFILLNVGRLQNVRFLSGG